MIQPKLDSAPGTDQIDYNIIKNLTPDSLSVLLQIYNNLFYQGIFPAEWNKSMVVLIPKPNGKGVRPISLLSCLLKIMEKIIYLRLRWFTESNAILPLNQTGFRPQCACSNNLVALTNYIQGAFINNALTI